MDMRLHYLTLLLVPQLVQGQSIDGAFPLKWKAEIGNLSYRSTIGIHNNTLFVGSNGKEFNDYYHEAGNGVYVLDGKTGQVIRQLGIDAWGDLDVNGVLVHGDRVFFGNDNDEFLCYDARNGNLIWRLPTSGDIEHVPSLIRLKNGNQVVVYATEFGEVRAVKPSSGETVWVHYHPEFDGWKPGKNRFVYRVGAAFRSGDRYFAPPAVLDVDGDEVLDLVYTSWRSLTVISGQNGRQLQYLSNLPISYYATPHIVESPEGPVTLIFRSDWESKTTSIRRFNLRTGQELAQSKVPYTFYEGISSTTISDSWTHGHQGTILRIRAQAPLVQLLPNPTAHLDQEPGRRYYSPDFISYKGKQWVAVIHEFNYKTDEAYLALLDPETWTMAHRFVLPAQTESIPHLVDVDGDGDDELLFGCYDGTLYCHEIPKN